MTSDISRIVCRITIIIIFVSFKFSDHRLLLFVNNSWLFALKLDLDLDEDDVKSLETLTLNKTSIN